MMNGFAKWCEEHPKALVLVSIVFVSLAIENYVHVSKWAEHIEQIKASEALGG